MRGAVRARGALGAEPRGRGGSDADQCDRSVGLDAAHERLGGARGQPVVLHVQRAQRAARGAEGRAQRHARPLAELVVREHERLQGRAANAPMRATSLRPTEDEVGLTA